MLMPEDTNRLHGTWDKEILVELVGSGPDLEAVAIGFNESERRLDIARAVMRIVRHCTLHPKDIPGGCTKHFQVVGLMPDERPN